jgi:hypothetical protein
MTITLDQIHQTNEATLSSMEKKFCEGARNLKLPAT